MSISEDIKSYYLHCTVTVEKVYGTEQTQSGSEYLRFKASDEITTPKGKATNLFGCKIWGQRIEKFEPLIRKGNRLLLVGPFETNKGHDRVYGNLTVMNAWPVEVSEEEVDESATPIEDKSLRPDEAPVPSAEELLLAGLDF
jgi:hypothetical protein